MEILIVCINYNSYEKLDNYLASLNQAFLNCSSSLGLKVIVADNSFEQQRMKEEKWSFRLEHFYTSTNMGYLGGASFGLQKERVHLHNYDYVIISNVDLTVAPDFFKKINNLDFSKEQIGCLAPSIFSLYEKRDRNPKILTRPTRWKMKFVQWMYRFPVLYHFYYNGIYILRRKKAQQISDRDIYAAHGSFLIFTRLFIPFLERFSFPTFLFGEEIFFAENLRRMSLRTYYYEGLKVFDSDHESTGKLKRKQFFKWNNASVTMLINDYFNE